MFKVNLEYLESNMPLSPLRLKAETVGCSSQNCPYDHQKCSIILIVWKELSEHKNSNDFDFSSADFIYIVFMCIHVISHIVSSFCVVIVSISSHKFSSACHSLYNAHCDICMSLSSLLSSVSMF